MAQKEKKREDNSINEGKKSSLNLFKIIAIILVLLMLSAVGFAVGVYLKLIDIPGMAEKWKLYDYPVIGQYFTKPQMNFEPVPIDDQQDPQAMAPSANPPVSASLPALQQANPTLVISDIEKEKLSKQKQQEDNKRISKLARLYGGMKAEDAVAVLNKLNDADVLAILNKMEEDQVSKILSLMEATRAARLTEIMLKGQSAATN
ncbi:magnesium transporter MgtE [bacterium BFN5]|nr:magnesium transporter MgtE [bacterium BFN5]